MNVRRAHQPQQHKLYEMLCKLFDTENPLPGKKTGNYGKTGIEGKTGNVGKSGIVLYNARKTTGLETKGEKGKKSFLELDVWIPSLKLGFELQVC